jgi:uncharacterized membrane protein YfcA
MTLLVLGIGSILTSMISAIVGMAGGIILLVLMTAFLPFQVVIPIHGIVQLVSNSFRSYLLRENIKWDIAIPIFLGLPFGVLISIYILKRIDDYTIPLILIVILIFYSIFKPKRLPPIIIAKKGFFLVGLIMGILSLLIGATGPFLAPFLLRPDLKKEEIVSTKAIAQMGAHLLKIPSFLYLGFNYIEHSLLIGLLILGTFLGTRLGIYFLGKIQEKVFRFIYKSALFIAGIRLIYKIIGPF